ncbi:cystine/glutamate transporter-like [Amphiura filiformis]|uniref:cystine/glutamate transporter-like n=1 Tax=Amphiura filiformis TaxID=82378 RepID=UPI003B210553
MESPGVDNVAFSNDDEITKNTDETKFVTSPIYTKNSATITTPQDLDAGIINGQDSDYRPTCDGQIPCKKTTPNGSAKAGGGRGGGGEESDADNLGLSDEIPKANSRLNGLRKTGELKDEANKQSISPSDKNAKLVPKKSNLVFLDKNINLLHCVSFILGSIIGTDIFFTPHGVLTNSGSIGVALLIWLICGIVCLLVAACYAELATTFRKSGGEFTFLYTAFGDRPAYVQVWMALIIGRTGGMAMMSVGFATLSSRVLYSGCDQPPDYLINLLAAATLSFLVFVNFVSVKWALLLQVIFAAIKVLAVLLLIGAGLVYIIQGRSRSLEEILGSPDDVTPSLIPVALYRGLYAYSGWQTVGFLTEEVKNPNRTIPLAMLISLPLVTAFYCLITIVYSSVLTPEQITNSNSVAIIYSRVVLGKWFWIMMPLIALSMLSSINGMIIAGSRMFVVASREQKAPEWWSMISVRWRTPLPALITLLCVSLIMIPIHKIASVLGWLYSFLWVSVGCACAVIPLMRRRQPKLQRPFTVPSAFPFICILFCVFALCMSLYLDARACGLTLAFAVSGFVVRRILEFLLLKTLWFPRLLDKITLFIQKLLFVVHQEKKTY